MKNFSVLFLMGFAILYLSSCNSPIVFSSPQPYEIEAQSSFLRYYQGAYFCESDSSFVIIDKETIYKEKKVLTVLSSSDIKKENGVYRIGNRLFIDSLGLDLLVEERSDSFFVELPIRDTFFAIGPKQVLTAFRGHQILNRKLEEDRWEVAILSLDYDRNLVFSLAMFPEDLERLSQVTTVENISRGDTIQFLLSPSVMEFDKILEEELVFEACDYFIRVVRPLDL